MKIKYLIGWIALWGLYGCSAPDPPLSLKTDFFHLQMDGMGNIVVMSDLKTDIKLPSPGYNFSLALHRS